MPRIGLKIMVVAAAVGFAGALGIAHAGAGTGLPPGAKILESVPIRGVHAGQAIAYRHGSTYLQVSSGSGSTPLTRKLGGHLLSLASPAARLVTVETAAASARQVCAFAVSPAQTRGAFNHGRKACIGGAESIRVHMQVMSVRRPDSAHVGEIRYRTVTRYVWNGTTFTRRWRYRAPDYPAGGLPVPNGIVKTRSGDKIALALEVARTEAQQEHGLMDRHSMDPDAGMIFVWTAPTHLSFWMQNTYIPLSIAFLGSDGTVQEIQDMAALSTDLHTPTAPYQYAIEANLGFFHRNNVQVGDKYVLNLASK